MTRAEKIAEAKRLKRAEKITDREIGERLGVSRGAVWKWLNPQKAREMARRDNARRQRAKREWEQQGTCKDCGGRCTRKTVAEAGLCESCWREREHDDAEARTRQMWTLRQQGLLNFQIAKRMGTTAPTVATMLQRSRVARFGIQWVPAPYNLPNPERNQRIMVLWNKGLTQGEIAAEIGTTPGSINSEIGRLRSQGHRLPFRRADKVAA